MTGFSNPASLAATGLSGAGTGLSALFPILQGSTAASNEIASGKGSFWSGIMSSEQSQLAADYADLKATQTDTFMRQRTAGALSNINAVLANTGTTDNSPSNWAVRNNFEARSDQARARMDLNYRMQATQDRNASTLYMLSGMNAMNIANQNANRDMLSGLLGGAGSLLKGVSGLFSVDATGKPTPFAASE